MNAVIFRENTEDIYTGWEVEAGSMEAERLLSHLQTEFGWEIPPDSGIGIKSVSETGTKRLVRAAMRYALNNGRRSLTLVHKGDIMTCTEGAFRTWGYDLVSEEFPDRAVSRNNSAHNPGDRLLVQDVLVGAFCRRSSHNPPSSMSSRP